MKIWLFLLLLSSLVAEDYEIGVPMTPYDRGNSEEDYSESYRIARDEALGAYFEGGGCGRPKGIYTCLYLNAGLAFDTDMVNGWSIEPQWEYYIPVSVIEADEKPFATAFYTKEQIEKIIKVSEEALYPNAKTFVTSGIQGESNPRTRPEGFSIDKAIETDDFQEIIEKFSIFQRFRNPKQHSDGYRHMNARVIGLDFEVLMRDHVLFNSIDDKDKDYEGGNPTDDSKNIKTGDPLRPLTWSHDHAKYGYDATKKQYLNKPFPDTQKGEKIMFEEPLVINLSQFAFPVRKYFDSEMFPATSKQPCMAQTIDVYNQALKGGEQMNYQELRKGFIAQNKIYNFDSSKEKCLPGVLGAKFAGPLSIMKTEYAIDAANIAIYRGLRIAAHDKFGNSKYGDPNSFYQLTERDQGKRKRDIIQYLGKLENGKKYRGRIGKEFPHCENWLKNPHFIPEKFNNDYKFGPRWGKLNQTYYEEEQKVDPGAGDRFLAVHWRYLAGCRKPRPGEELIMFDPSRVFVR